LPFFPPAHRAYAPEGRKAKTLIPLRGKIPSSNMVKTKITESSNYECKHLRRYFPALGRDCVFSPSSPPASPERLAMAGRWKVRKQQKNPNNPACPMKCIAYFIGVNPVGTNYAPLSFG